MSSAKKCELGKNDAEANILARKLYGCSFTGLSRTKVFRDKEWLDNDIKKQEHREKIEHLKYWKRKINADPSAKTGWLHRKGNHLDTVVEEKGKTSTTKTQAVEMLRQYWVELWEKQGWEEKERIEKASTLAQILEASLRNYKVDNGRPNLDSFRTCAEKVKGCAGLDGWSRQELKIAIGNKVMARMVWQNMAIWEVFGQIPTPINQCKLVHVPKKVMRRLPCGQFRPICIMSAWWRCWSSSWTSSQWVKGWTATAFPPSVAGGMPGAYGPERMATLIAHKVAHWKHGLTMDFKHAFDTVDIPLLKRTLDKVLPIPCRRWYHLFATPVVHHV